jgi:hypothetical protein
MKVNIQGKTGAAGRNPKRLLEMRCQDFLKEATESVSLGPGRFLSAGARVMNKVISRRFQLAVPETGMNRSLCL